MYRLMLFGGLSLEGPSGPLTGRIVQRRQLALLALLARSPDSPLSRGRAVGLLWPECTEDRARARLSDVLYVVRQELGEDAVVSVGDAVRLNTERVWSDVAAFDEAADASQWEEAVDLYGGTFLEGFHPAGAVEFERWVEAEGRRLADRYREGLEALAEEAEANKAWSRAVSWWRRRAADERTNSRVAVRLMRALAAAGNVPGALEHAGAHERFLQEELGVPPPARLRSFAERLATGGAGDPEAKAEPDLGPASREEGPSEGRSDRDSRRRESAPGPTDGARPVGGQEVALGGDWPWLVVAGVAGLALLVGGGVWLSDALGGHDEAWVREQAIPEIEELSREGQYDSAWAVARHAAAIAPDNPDLARLLPEFTWLWPGLQTDPSGARALHRPYAETEAAWEELGTTPLDSLRLPLGATVVRLEVDGYRPVHIVPDHYLEHFPVFTLDPPEELPEGMVRVPGWAESVDGETVDLGDFFMDRYPVTNRAYLRFVEAGGYRNPEYWNHPFVLNGDTLGWEEAMEGLTDRTGRPGPSTWEVGRYPEGHGDYPVGGVSWYEAAAYARFTGKSLPSVHHWRRAYGSDFFREHMIPESNLHSDGPAPVGEHAGMGPFGTFDMAGNVREWTHNERGEDRYILGAGWNDPQKLALSTSYAQPAVDRSPTNGFRLVSYLDAGPGLERALAPFEPRPVPDFVEEASPPTDGEFEIYRRMYAYDPVPLEARVEATDTARRWVRRTISFDAAYEGDRVLLHLYLPTNASPPFQTVVYWPGSGALTFTSIDQTPAVHTRFILQSGRAFAFPVLKGTLERRNDTVDPEPAPESTRFRDLTVERVQDLMRTIDYLETRDDINAERLAYFGWSWGGGMSPLVLSLEPRLQAAVLHVAGVTGARPLPEVDPLNHLSRVSLPVLMLNGRWDTVYPLETHARPFFELLGAPPENKRLVVAESGHFVPRPELIRESLDWLDRYLGPVRRP